MEIEFFKNGEKDPVRKFLDSLPAKERAKVLRNIGLLKEFGLSAGAQFIEPIKNGLFSLRTVFSGNQIRVLFFTMVGNKVVLVHGFKKKTQAIPRGEIETALNRKKEYFERYTRR